MLRFRRELKVVYLCWSLVPLLQEKKMKKTFFCQDFDNFFSEKNMYYLSAMFAITLIKVSFFVK